MYGHLKLAEQSEQLDCFDRLCPSSMQGVLALQARARQLQYVTVCNGMQGVLALQARSPRLVARLPAAACAPRTASRTAAALLQHCRSTAAALLQHCRRRLVASC